MEENKLNRWPAIYHFVILLASIHPRTQLMEDLGVLPEVIRRQVSRWKKRVVPVHKEERLIGMEGRLHFKRLWPATTCRCIMLVQRSAKPIKYNPTKLCLELSACMQVDLEANSEGCRADGHQDSEHYRISTSNNKLSSITTN